MQFRPPWRVLLLLLLAEAVSLAQEKKSFVPPTQEVRSYCRSLLPGESRAEPLRRACEFSLSLQENMPSFTCEMTVEKYEDISGGFRSTKYMQRIQARARYSNGKDSYDDLRINGKRVHDIAALTQGTWSFGEFGIKLLAAFAPKDHPTFRYERSTTVNGVPVIEYRFQVAQADNHIWRWTWGKESSSPGYSGVISVAKKTGNVVRLRLDSDEHPSDDFPIQSVESKTDYSYFDFKDGSGFVLPSKAEIHARMKDRLLYRTLIGFEHCQRFRVDSRIVTNSSQ